DGLSLTFVLLICTIGSFVLLYASSYLEGNPRAGSFLSTLLAFMVAMLGLVLSDNLVLLFIFWELTSITSFLLIGFDSHRDAARQSAVRALLVTGLGGLALLAGVILLGLATDSFVLSEILAPGGNAGLHEHPLFTPIVVLTLLGCFTKSAIFPFHFWLPGAMEAPSPVSALLHSATMVKAGVYLIARLHPAMTGSPQWDTTISVFGGFTMLLGAFLAIRNVHFKKVLAYSTVSSLGILIMLIGIGSSKAAAVYLIAHAMFKGCLFMVAGSITKRTGEKDVEQIGGMLGRMPVTSGVAFLAALSMAGMVPLFGFVSKELMLKAGLAAPHQPVVFTAAIAVAGTLTVMAALLVGLKPLLGPLTENVAESKPAAFRQLLGPAVLAVAGLITGLLPNLTLEPLLLVIMNSIDGHSHEPGLKLSPWKLLYPPTTATYLSIAALIVGLVLFLGRSGVRAVIRPVAPLDAVGPYRIWESGVAGVLAIAGLSTRLLQSGNLSNYVRTTLLFIVAVVAFGAWRAGLPTFEGITLEDVSPLDWVAGIAIVVLTGAVMVQRTALASVAVLGGIGFMLAMIYALYGAPDVATTQFAVETLVVIIFVLVIFHLTRYRNLSSSGAKLLDGSVAIVFGVIMTVLTLAVSLRDAPESISAFHAERSLTEGYGRNVVNVILVDFRAMDTLGEVFVVAIAAVGVFTLLALRSRPRAPVPLPGEENGAPSTGPAGPDRPEGSP
ncbi:MAG: hydrogen gas-evolving membrane-bound hydrogenase subunit E, partial [Planctomycetota bacterium]